MMRLPFLFKSSQRLPAREANDALDGAMKTQMELPGAADGPLNKTSSAAWLRRRRVDEGERCLRRACYPKYSLQRLIGGRWRHKRLCKRQPQPASQSHHQRHQHRIVLALIRLAGAPHPGRPASLWVFRCFSVSSRQPGPGMAWGLGHRLGYWRAFGAVE